MAYNLWCKNHLNDDIEHRKECTVCDTKGQVVCEDSTVLCPFAEVALKVMGETMGGGVQKVASMTPQQRQKELTKRSHAHFIKEGQERKKQMLKDSFGKK